MSTTLTAAFKTSGVPQTGLSPTVTIWKMVNGVKTIVHTDEAMTEQGSGLYTYEFTAFNILENYIYLYDAGAASDTRYLYGSWSGITDWIAQIPRGGGGGSYKGITQADIEEITKGIKEAIEGTFDGLELDFDLSEQTKNLDKEVKAQLKVLSEFSKTQKKELIKLLDEKLKEIKAQKIEVTTEKVDTSEMQANLSRELVAKITERGKIEVDTIDEALGEFAQWFMKENKKAIEVDRERIRNEERESLVAEFKKTIQ